MRERVRERQRERPRKRERKRERRRETEREREREKKRDRDRVREQEGIIKNQSRHRQKESRATVEETEPISFDQVTVLESLDTELIKHALKMLSKM